MGSYNTGADTGFIVVAVIVDILIIAGLYVWVALSLNALFRKVGEPDWAGWVPYYNTALILKLGGFSPFLIFVILVPYLGPLAIWVLVVISAYRINAGFGYREGAGVGMTFLAALLFPVWSSVLGWGSARWIGAGARMRSGAVGAPAGYAGPGYPQPGGGDAPGYGAYPAPPYPGSQDSGTGYAAPGATWLSAATDAPATSDGYAQPAAPAGYVPPAGYAAPSAPAGYIPPVAQGYVPPTADPYAPAEPAPAATEDPFAPLYAPDDDDLEGVDDPVPGPRRSVIDAETVAHTPAAAPPAAGAVIDAVPVSAAAMRAEAEPAPAPADEPESAPASEFAAASEFARAAASAPPEDAAQSDAPTAAVPVDAAPVAAAPADPWAPPAPVAAARRSPEPAEPADFSDTSAEVSAVAGAPMAGVPMSARSSVSALRHEPELPDAEGAFDETIIAPRRRTEWMLTPPLGAPIRLTSPVLILGRRPSADPAYPNAQLIDIADETRTVSKTHARLELAADHWTITDLGSTNGVVLVDEAGAETDLPAGASQLAGERFLLGDAELRLTRGKE